MKTAMPQIIRRPEYLLSDDKRVITRFFAFSPQRTQAILARAMAVKEPQVSELLAEAMEKFSWRHRDLRVILLRNCAHVGRITGETMQGFSEQRKLLIGAYFSLEYSIESAALFNPSIVLHPDQPSDQPTYPLRFLLSLRATGEGHISSIVFRSGTIHADGTIELAPPTRYADWARPEPYKNYDRRSFVRKLLRIQGHLAVVRRIVDDLPDPFTLVELEDTIAKLSKDPDRPYGFEQVTADVLWLANAHYTLSFPPACPPTNG